MRPDELIARMLAEANTAILFDRRRNIEEQAWSIGYELLDNALASSPIGNAKVTVALVRRRGAAGTELTKQGASGRRSGRASFVKLLDRFFIPAAGDPTISALFFELIASRYEELTAIDVNLRTAEILLKAALPGAPSEKPWKVLDFGCGTGCAIDALKALGNQGHNVRLIGTDLSDAMLSIARGRGEAVVPLSEWRSLPTNSFAAVISCFVLHYGVPAEDFANIARQLTPGGVFSANLFKSDEIKLTHLKSTLSAEGLDLISNEQLSTTPHTSNRHLVFKKHNGSDLS